VGVREGLERLEGVEWIAEKADHASQTCEIKFKDGRLPDTANIGKHIEGCGVGASLRAVEIKASGELFEAGNSLCLRLSKDETVILASLTTKVQWDLAKKRLHPATRSEIAAIGRIRQEWKHGKRKVEIIGPYRASEGKGSSLEVREYKWLP